MVVGPKFRLKLTIFTFLVISHQSSVWVREKIEQKKEYLLIQLTGMLRWMHHISKIIVKRFPCIQFCPLLSLFEELSRQQSGALQQSKFKLDQFQIQARSIPNSSQINEFHCTLPLQQSVTIDPKRSKKYVNHMTYPLSSTDISSFSPEPFQQIPLHQEIQLQIGF